MVPSWRQRAVLGGWNNHGDQRLVGPVSRSGLQPRAINGVRRRFERHESFMMARLIRPRQVGEIWQFLKRQFMRNNLDSVRHPELPVRNVSSRSIGCSNFRNVSFGSHPDSTHRARISSPSPSRSPTARPFFTPIRSTAALVRISAPRSRQ
jgi:hypothetical protein